MLNIIYRNKKKGRKKEKAKAKKALKNILKNLLLRQCQRGRIFNLHAHNEIAPFGWFLALWHSQPRELLLPRRLGRARAADAQRAAVDRLDVTLPARECLFKVNLDAGVDVVAVTLKGWVFFLRKMSVGVINIY